jgi:cytochrome P450
VPLLGHAWPLWREPYGFVKSLRKSGDLVRIEFGTMPVCFVNSAQLAYEVLVTKARSFEKGRLFDRMRTLLGSGLATADNVTHRRHRRLMQPLFHRARIAGYAEAMNSQARAIADSLKPGETVAWEQVLTEYAVGTLAQTMFSGDVGRPAQEALRRNVPVIIENLLPRAASPKFLDRFPIRANRRYDAAQKEVHRAVDAVIAETRESGGTDQHDDLLSLLLGARDAETGEGLTDAEVHDELGTILIGGVEPIVSTLAWACYEIARHPEVEERLGAEIDAVVGDHPVAFEDLPKLQYTRRVLDEALRMHSVTMLMRRTTEPVELGGVTLPAGSEVAFSLYAVHQDPRWFPEPERFDPDRWLPERREGLPREAFAPFGAGPRKCIGDAFALMEMTILLATIVRRWRLLPVPGRVPQEVVSAMPRPDHMPMRVEPRSRGASADPAVPVPQSREGR